MGVNRSATLVIAYLLSGFTPAYHLLSATLLVKKARGVILGNKTFRLQLLHLAHSSDRLESESEIVIRNEWADIAQLLPPALSPKPPPPDSWVALVSVTKPEVGKFCYVNVGGEFDSGVIEDVTDGFATVLLESGHLDRVQCFTPDLIVCPE